jgi:hypothetical protein
MAELGLGLAPQMVVETDVGRHSAQQLVLGP